MKTIHQALRAGLLALPLAVSAQSITVAPALAPGGGGGIAAVPVDNPMALLAVAAVMVAGAWFVLRNRQRRALFTALWATAVTAAMLWHSPDLRAQIVNAFTNPAGETQAIAVNQQNIGAQVTGFVPVDFTNSTGVVQRVTAIVEPTLQQCFPAGFGFLDPTATPPGAVAQCAVGSTIAPAGVCRVNVETICREAVAAAPKTTLGLAPSTLSFEAGATGDVTVTNTGPDAAVNVAAIVPSGISVTAQTCGAAPLAPGASCTFTLSAAAAQSVSAVQIGAANALASTVNVTVTAPPTVDVGDFALRGTCGVLGVQGPGFTLLAGPTTPLPVGTTVAVTASGIANAGVFSVSGGTATVQVLSSTARLITLTAEQPAGTTISFRTTLSISVPFQLNAVASLPDGYDGSGSKTAGNVSSTQTLCSAN